MHKIELPELTCLRCGHRWTPRSSDVKQCPGCRSVNWNKARSDALTATSYARIGFLGNPSDGFFGKTLSACVTNFKATVSLEPSKNLRIITNPDRDHTKFPSLAGLSTHVARYGFYGALRLILATCYVFRVHCIHKNICTDQNFNLAYDTDIPRQVGLGGSSAIVTACLKALIRFYDVDIPIEEQPGMALAAEKGLGITAGLQDRVVQIYGGAVRMNFDREFMEKHGHGAYLRARTDIFPKLLLIYDPNRGCESGRMHNRTHLLFNNGDKSVIKAMNGLANLVQPGLDAMMKLDNGTLARLMRRNYRIRSELYGDEIDGNTQRMIDIAEKHGCAAKLPGSGGSVIAMYDGDEQFHAIQSDAGAWNYKTVALDVERKILAGM